MNYSKSQLQAVSHVNGPMLVLAGPGSGKTAVITGRVNYLIESAGVKGENILVITFTKAAALEMKERAKKRMGSERGVRFSTFHSVFFLILKSSYGYEVKDIINEEVSRKFFREKMKEYHLEDIDEKEFLKNILSEISIVKSESLSLSDYYSSNFPVEVFRELFMDYSDFMKKRGLIDFDDMMLLCDKLFKEKPDVLRIWQEKYQYILIDEFQDSSRLQFELVKKMAEPENNLFVVGDDDQSIYRFRGAKPEIMLGFEKLYKECKKVILSDNYRSTKAIVDFAEKIIAENKYRFSKKIEAINQEGASPPVIRVFTEKREEDDFIVKEILKSREEGLAFADIAVVYRTNLLARPIVSKLMEYNIPFTMKEAFPDIYDHFIARNIFDYLNLASGVRDFSSMLRIMNRPNRFLSRDSLDAAVVSPKGQKETVSFMRWRDFYKGKQWMVERLLNFQHDLTVMQTLSPFAALHYLRKMVGYDEFLSDYAKERGIDSEELFDILLELSEDAKPFQTFSDWKNHIKEKREKKKELEKKSREEKRDAVVISTMHSCKGLEFHKVFVPDVVEGVLPYKKALKQSDIEEERRLFYVAVTRAKKELFISFPKKIYGKEKEASPFIKRFLGRNIYE